MVYTNTLSCTVTHIHNYTVPHPHLILYWVLEDRASTQAIWYIYNRVVGTRIH